MSWSLCVTAILEEDVLTEFADEDFTGSLTELSTGSTCLERLVFVTCSLTFSFAFSFVLAFLGAVFVVVVVVGVDVAFVVGSVDANDEDGDDDDVLDEVADEIGTGGWVVVAISVCLDLLVLAGVSFSFCLPLATLFEDMV